MTDETEQDKSLFTIDGVEYPEHELMIRGIGKNSPCLLSGDSEALVVRRWFRDNDLKCTASLGWIDSLYRVSCLFSEGSHSQEIPREFIEWRELKKHEKNKKISDIRKACSELSRALNDSGLPFSDLKVSDIEVFNPYWNLLIHEGIDLGSEFYQHGIVRPWGIGESIEGGVGDMPITVLLSQLEENVNGFLEFDGLKKTRPGKVSAEIIEFGRVCLTVVSEEFSIKATPNELIASIIALRFPGCGVVGNDVKNWKR